MTDAPRLRAGDRWLLGLLILSWGVNWPVMKIGVAGFSPLGFAALSALLGAGVVAAIAAAADISLRVPREHRAELAVLALTNMVLWIALTSFGLQLLPSGRAAILDYTMPIWAAGLGIVLYGERPSARLWLGVAAAAFAVVLLLAGEFTTIAGHPLGTLLMLASAALWGYGTHRMRRRRQPTHILSITFWSLAATAVACAPLAFLVARPGQGGAPDTAQWAAVAFNASVIFGFAQPAWFRLATILPPVASGLSVMLIPIVGLFSGMLLLGEQPSWRDWVALAAIVVSMATVLLPARGR